MKLLYMFWMNLAFLFYCIGLRIQDETVCDCEISGNTGLQIQNLLTMLFNKIQNIIILLIYVAVLMNDL